ncbi:MAG: hypothetical protein V4456_16500 [Bacteroidota bacterium]
MKPIQFKIYHAQLALAIMCLSACASLSKSQLNEVNGFGRLTKNFSAYPSKVVSSYNQAHQQIELYRANSLPTPDAHFEAILQANRFKQKSDLITPKIDLSLQIINQYAQALIALTADQHVAALDTASTGLGKHIEGLVDQYNALETEHPLPSGAGGVIGKLVSFGGGVYIRARQAKIVRQLVPEADPVIGILCDRLITFLEPPAATLPGRKSLQELIVYEQEQLKLNYTRFLGLNRDLVNLRYGRDTSRLTGSIVNQRFALLSDDKSCLQLMENLDQTETLRTQCITAIRDLRKVHSQLVKDLEKKKDIEELVAEVQYYRDHMQQLNTTLKAIK